MRQKIYFNFVNVRKHLRVDVQSISKPFHKTLFRGIIIRIAHMVEMRFLKL